MNFRNEEAESFFGNIMYDRRIVRGNTYAQHTLPAVSILVQVQSRLLPLPAVSILSTVPAYDINIYLQCTLILVMN